MCLARRGNVLQTCMDETSVLSLSALFDSRSIYNITERNEARRAAGVRLQPPAGQLTDFINKTKTSLF